VQRSRLRRSIQPLPHTSSWHSDSLVKLRDNITLCLMKPLRVICVLAQIWVRDLQNTKQKCHSIATFRLEMWNLFWNALCFPYVGSENACYPFSFCSSHYVRFGQQQLVDESHCAVPVPLYKMATRHSPGGEVCSLLNRPSPSFVRTVPVSKTVTCKNKNIICRILFGCLITKLSPCLIKHHTIYSPIRLHGVVFN
jgi:hypothetical protein